MLKPRAKRSVALGYLENTVRRPERLKGQFVSFILPLQGNGIWGARAQGGVALCPGLYCESPLG